MIDEAGPAVCAPEACLEPWTLRLLRRAAQDQRRLEGLAGRAAESRRVRSRLDPVVDAYMVAAVDAWSQRTLGDLGTGTDDVKHLVEAELAVGYLFGRLVVGTAAVDQRWSTSGDRHEMLGWLDDTVASVDWSAIPDLLGGQPAELVIRDLVAVVQREVTGEAVWDDTDGRAGAFFHNGLCAALVEHSAVRPPAGEVWVDLTVLGDVLPDDVTERVWIGEALGCLLARVDRQGRCSEADLRDAADELGGERGLRYFRKLRDWGVVDYRLGRRGRRTVTVRQHVELAGGQPAG